jgi:hypothetical protein
MLCFCKLNKHNVNTLKFFSLQCILETINFPLYDGRSKQSGIKRWESCVLRVWLNCMCTAKSNTYIYNIQGAYIIILIAYTVIYKCTL